jgi:anti-sigma B factor antagonist
MAHKQVRSQVIDQGKAAFYIQPFAGSVVVAARGEIDVDTAATFDDVLGTAMEQSRRLVVDLSGVSFMHSTAVGVLVGVRQRVRERRGSISLVAPPSPVRRIVTGGQLQQPFAVFDTLEDALNARPGPEIPAQRSGDADAARHSGPPPD